MLLDLCNSSDDSQSHSMSLIGNYLHVRGWWNLLVLAQQWLSENFIETKYFHEIDTTLSKLSGKNIEEY